MIRIVAKAPWFEISQTVKEKDAEKFLKYIKKLKKSYVGNYRRYGDFPMTIEIIHC